VRDLAIHAAISVPLGSAFALLIWSIFRFPVASEPPVHRRLAAQLGGAAPATLFDQPGLKPLLSGLLSIARRLNNAPLRRLVHQDLNASGNPKGYSVDEQIAIALFAACVGALVGIAAMIALRDPDPLLLVAGAVVGGAIPLINLHNEAQARVLRIGKQLPYTLDLIALLMQAGSNFTEAVETVIRDEPDSDLNQELRIVLTEVDFGSDRARAMAEMARRIPLENLRSVVTAVNQADSLGTPLASILSVQAQVLRMQRSVRAEKLSASASLRILLPTMLILAAAMIVFMGPILMQYLESDLFG